jgi:hypothetical protein
MNHNITLVNSLVDLTTVQPNQVLGSAILASDFSSKNKKNGSLVNYPSTKPIKDSGDTIE